MTTKLNRRQVLAAAMTVAAAPVVALEAIPAPQDPRLTALKAVAALTNNQWAHVNGTWLLLFANEDDRIVDRTRVMIEEGRSFDEIRAFAWDAEDARRRLAGRGRSA